MSRIGKKVIPLPSGVKYKVEGNTVLVEGPKGKMSAMIADGISLETKDGALHVNRASEDKAAVHGLTRTMARDLGPLGIRINTVVPGWVMTERQLTLWVDKKANKMLDEVQCLKGRVMPVDLARMALYLASEDSRMCSAQEFTVDAGWA